MSLSLQPSPASDVVRCEPSPPGTWDDGRLQWRVPQLNSRDAAAECTATLTGPVDRAARGAEPLAASLLGQPLRVQFGCEGVTISGLELEVKMTNPQPQPQPQPQPKPDH